MLFKPALFLALIALTTARPQPSAVKTIASASGSKSSIKSPSQKLAEKNSAPPASIVELQSIGQAESTNLNVALSASQPQTQDSDIALQYSSNENLVPAAINKEVVGSSVKNEGFLDHIEPKLQTAPVPYSIPLTPQSDLAKNLPPINVEPLVSAVVPSIPSEVPQPVVSEVVHETPLKPVENIVSPSSQSVVLTPNEVSNSPVSSSELSPASKEIVPKSAPVLEAQPVKLVEPVVPVVPVPSPAVVETPSVPAVAPVENVVNKEVVSNPVVPVEAVVNKEAVNNPVVPASVDSQLSPVNVVPVSEVNPSIPVVQNSPPSLVSESQPLPAI